MKVELSKNLRSYVLHPETLDEVQILKKLQGWTMNLNLAGRYPRLYLNPPTQQSE